MTPGLDYTQLFISLTAGAGTRSMSLLSPTSKPLVVAFGPSASSLTRWVLSVAVCREVPQKDMA